MKHLPILYGLLLHSAIQSMYQPDSDQALYDDARPIIGCIEFGQQFSQEAMKAFKGLSMAPWPWVDSEGRTLLHLVALYCQSYQDYPEYKEYIMKVALEHHPWHLFIRDNQGKHFGHYAVALPYSLIVQATQRNHWYYLEQYINHPQAHLADLKKILAYLGTGAKNRCGENALHVLLKNYGWHQLSHRQLKKRFNLVRQYASMNEPLPDGQDPLKYVQTAWKKKNGHWYHDLDRRLAKLIAHAQQQELAHLGADQ